MHTLLWKLIHNHSFHSLLYEKNISFCKELGKGYIYAVSFTIYVDRMNALLSLCVQGVGHSPHGWAGADPWRAHAGCEEGEV